MKIVNDSPEFVDRVMKENLWSEEYTRKVIEEYKKFLYLSGWKSVAPSFEIDQVWHAHMLFSKDYKEVTEQLRAGRFLHHNPTMKTEKFSKRDEYKETKDLYKTMFGTEPPPDIWTDWTPNHYAYIDLTKHWVIPEGNWKTLIKILFKHLKQKLWDF